MKVILTQSIASLGKAGDLKNVADGYASNFLLPKKLAEVANKDNIKKYQILAAQDQETENQNKENLLKTAQMLSGLKIEIQAKGKNGKLFGSVGTKQILTALKNQGIEIDNSQIELAEPIKETGERDVPIALDQKIRAVLKITVSAMK